MHNLLSPRAPQALPDIAHTALLKPVSRGDSTPLVTRHRRWSCPPGELDIYMTGANVTDHTFALAWPLQSRDAQQPSPQHALGGSAPRSRAHNRVSSNNPQLPSHIQICRLFLAIRVFTAVAIFSDCTMAFSQNRALEAFALKCAPTSGNSESIALV